MPDPVFESRTARLNLPMLFAGQAQKEFTVNESLARIDALLHGAIDGESNSPPASAADGTAWLVGSSPGGDWAGHSGAIAARQSGSWFFFTPFDGLKLLNRANGQEIRFSSGWKAASRPVAPSGGSTVDAEARSAISLIIAALATAGIIPPA